MTMIMGAPNTGMMGQGLVGQYDANGNLIPGTGGQGNPNGPFAGPGEIGRAHV